MKRPLCLFVLVILAFVAVFMQTGCGRESSSAEREERRDSAAERRSSREVEPKHVGEVAEVGPLLVTLNDVKGSSSGEQGEGAASHYYAVVDLSLENGAQGSFDASDVDYLLRDEEGYSFERKSVSDQKPPPEGQVMAGGKASGQVAFDLGTGSIHATLTLSVSLSEKPDVSPGVFEFEVNHDAEKEKPQTDTSAETKRAAAPAYNLVEDPTGGLTVEVPPSWGVETGEASEKDAGPRTWSYYAGEYLTSSITASANLETWYSSGAASGTYMVASKALAQYSDYELTHSLFNADKGEKCTPGPYKDLGRPPYSGKIQTWYNCGADGATSFTVAAAPEGRECVAVVGARISDEGQRGAVQHILDSFKVDCGQVGSQPLATPSATASPEPTPSPEPSASSAPASTQPAGTKHVKVVVTSDVPVDVSITDDNFDVSIGEEITGSKTYEFDIAADSGLLVSAMNADLRGNVSITVYEDGQLKTQDSDSSGWAQISY